MKNKKTEFPPKDGLFQFHPQSCRASKAKKILFSAEEVPPRVRLSPNARLQTTDKRKGGGGHVFTIKQSIEDELNQRFASVRKAEEEHEGRGVGGSKTNGKSRDERSLLEKNYEHYANIALNTDTRKKSDKYEKPEKLERGEKKQPKVALPAKDKATLSILAAKKGRASAGLPQSRSASN